MTRILFVCHGNICRSPMAEFVMKHLVSASGLDSGYEIHSAATSREEIGNGIYPPARRMLEEMGIPYDHRKRARQITAEDFSRFDYVVAMERYNIRNMAPFCEDGLRHRVSLLLDYTSRPGDVADPWYTGDFLQAFMDIDEGCRGLLEYIEKGKVISSKE